MTPVTKAVRRKQAVVEASAEGAVFVDALGTLRILPGRPEMLLNPASEKARRALNVLVAGVALLLCLPLMVLIAVVVVMSSRGPVLYTQTRVGIDRRRGGRIPGTRRVDYGGRLFKIYKFRTMYVSDVRTDEVWAQPDDPRVTPIGRILRKYRLDELPQLVNVLKGDMNVVGPRPEQPKIFTNLRNSISHYPFRQKVLPGITGLAQIRQHYDASIEDVRRKVIFDLEYIARCSWWQDVKVLFQTVPVVLFQKGAW